MHKPSASQAVLKAQELTMRYSKLGPGSTKQTAALKRAWFDPVNHAARAAATVNHNQTT